MTPSKLAAARRRNERIVRRSEFITSRELGNYKSLLGTRFMSILHLLGGRHHWIDVGAGDADALCDWAEQAKEMGLPVPPMTAITVAATRTYRRRKLVATGKLAYLSRKRFEDYAPGSLRKAKLITDVFGATTYTDAFDAVIAQMAVLLAKQGTAYLVFPAHQLQIQNQSGKRITIGHFFDQCRGIEIVEWRRLSTIQGPELRIGFRRTEGKISVPKLELLSMQSLKKLTPAPFRTYRLIATKPNVR